MNTPTVNAGGLWVAGRRRPCPRCADLAVRIDRLTPQLRRTDTAGARDFVLGVSTFAVVGVLAAADGGYFPKAWGVSLLLFFGIAIAVVVLPGVQLSVLEGLMVASLAALAAWSALSALWSTDPGQSMLEAQRALVYLGGTGALLLIARRESVVVVLGAVASACVLVSGYALTTRLYPDVFGTVAVERFDRFALSEPVGYSNALGLMAAIGVILTLGFATGAKSAVARGLAGAGLVPLASALYFTASRAAVVALAVGLAIAVAWEPARRKFLGAAAAALALPMMSVWVSTRVDALGKPGIPLDEAARAGHRLALVLIVFAAGTAALVCALVRLRRAPRPRLACVVLVMGVALAGVGLGWVSGGSRPQLQTTSTAGADLMSRLASTSLHGRLDLWSVAWRAAGDHPLLGTGAGSFARSWLQDRPTRLEVRDAHNLYLETLSELGPVGLGLLLTVLVAPLVAAARARHVRLIPTAAGAWVAYSVHAGAHWDWEMPVLTLAALGCGGAILVAARRKAPVWRPSMLVRIGILGGAAALCGFAFVGLVGNVAFERGVEAASVGSTTSAKAQARRAKDWMPWSGEPWRLLGEVARAEGDVVLARASFRHGLERDPHGWGLWVGLASTSRGRARVHAVEQATRLNPHAVEVAVLRRRALSDRDTAVSRSDLRQTRLRAEGKR